MTGKVAELVAHAVEKVGKSQLAESKKTPKQGCFYGWVIVTVCIFCKIFKVQGQNNVMSYTVPHLLEDFKLSHAELGGLFSAATIMAGMVQPMLGRTMDRFGGRVCIPAMQVALCVTLAVFSTWQRPEDRFLLHLEVVGIFFFLRMLSLGAGEIFPNACVQQWFNRRRGRAVGVVFTFQWLGNAIFGTVIAGIVAEYSWHMAAMMGAVANLVLAPVSALLLRRNPESCGMLPDGYASVPEDEEVALKESQDADSELSQTDARKFWAHFVFTFFYAVMFGGCDFYMIEMIAEAAGRGTGSHDGNISVSLHIFAPFALASSFSVPCVGELMDRYCSAGSGKKWLPSALLAVAGVLTGAVTMGLTCIHNWPEAVLYGIVRGTLISEDYFRKPSFDVIREVKNYCILPKCFCGQLSICVWKHINFSRPKGKYPKARDVIEIENGWTMFVDDSSNGSLIKFWVPPKGFVPCIFRLKGDDLAEILNF